jgi:hypothetical protein
MIFPKEEQVRIEQLRDELYSILGAFPSMAIQWNGVDAVEIEDIDGKATQYQSELQTMIDAHVPTTEYFDYEKDPIIDVAARAGWRDLGNWATWEPQQAQDYVNDEILSGWDQEQIDEYINVNVVNIASAKTALKLLAGNIITMRTILGIIAKVILYIRDILIKRL